MVEGWGALADLHTTPTWPWGSHLNQLSCSPQGLPALGWVCMAKRGHGWLSQLLLPTRHGLPRLT